MHGIYNYIASIINMYLISLKDTPKSCIIVNSPYQSFNKSGFINI